MHRHTPYTIRMPVIWKGAYIYFYCYPTLTSGQNPRSKFNNRVHFQTVCPMKKQMAPQDSSDPRVPTFKVRLFDLGSNQVKFQLYGAFPTCTCIQVIINVTTRFLRQMYPGEHLPHTILPCSTNPQNLTLDLGSNVPVKGHTLSSTLNIIFQTEKNQNLHSILSQFVNFADCV